MRVHQRRIFLFSCMVLSVLLFLMIAFNVKDPLLLNFGEWVQSYLYDFLGPFGDFVFVVITYIGSAYVSYPLMLIFLLVFLFQRRYWTMLLLLLNLIGVRLLNGLLKSIFERPRPELEHLVQAGSYSFPSGHSMHSIAFFGFLAYLLHRKLKETEKSAHWVWWSAALLIGLIGLSRVYLGVHYPFDVIGGFLAGGSWLFFNILLYTYIPENERLHRRAPAEQEQSH
ncbi:phosphatase PAP2 family protein [Virgibacillus alimentarius]|uniref:Undecaprenyl-diphosphatase n=1 Tax=Virgibacillus alimentarius TaxID=698769 RepID=A0ABS4SBY1_9BACI|nr:phosphatase PAP2 family protein [Virgibacillus alimentarius]MBP2259026.1 undecaprenyl-diphosphatase [Virgibacillus alimentarius]